MLASLALAGVAAGQPVPGDALRARVEAELGRMRGPLRANLGHYALVFPVEQSDLLAFLRPVRVYGKPGDLHLGTDHGAEPHGGGLLAFLLAWWRPDGRAADLRDRYRFGPDAEGTALAELYASLRRQVYLPVPGRAPDAIDAALPGEPVLPRVRFRRPGGDVAEADAYQLLGLLVEREPDLDAPWTNHQGQRLTAALLLDHVRRVYLTSSDTPGEPADHSHLHLVDLLLAASARSGSDPEEIQQRFLAVEMSRRAFEPADANAVLAHHAESLGRLVADPRVGWSPPERAQARAWLAWLEAERFRDLASEEWYELTHLLLGLRLVDAHRERLAGGE